ncbi:hypothetical protein CMO92_03475 [Candidatus Woesearchaeota archaeon]|nr:hypothetical protein [Candidatus Woesearchaeota archaeon]|tara:strand:+ start:461 stop:1303 length:843 start_codon:yes stop_codon:yes gene_type:complete
MANLIPMAGIGSRFTDGGHLLPKALIPVSGIPMIAKVIREMPPSDKWIFIVRKEHVDDYQIDKIIKKEKPEAIIILIDYTTEGQACTCMLAESHLDPEEELFIAACDNSSLINEDNYNKLKEDPEIDAIIWTFTKRIMLKENPHSYGWVKLAEDNLTIKDISVKKPISDDPYKDHAVVASFYFKNSKDFFTAAKLMIEENYRINNEFYVDAIPLFLTKINKRSVIFDVDLFLLWGAPKELYIYQEKEYYFRNNIQQPSMSDEDKRLYNVWQRYFKQTRTS